MSAGGRSGRGREAGRAAREGAAGSPGALERARRAGRMRGGAEVRSDGGRFGRRGGRVVQALGVKNKPPLTKREEFGTRKRRREKTTLGTRAGGEPAPASWAAGARNRIGLQERGASGRRGPGPRWGGGAAGAQSAAQVPTPRGGFPVGPQPSAVAKPGPTRGREGSAAARSAGDASRRARGAASRPSSPARATRPRAATSRPGTNFRARRRPCGASESRRRGVPALAPSRVATQPLPHLPELAVWLVSSGPDALPSGCKWTLCGSDSTSRKVGCA